MNYGLTFSARSLCSGDSQWHLIVASTETTLWNFLWIDHRHPLIIDLAGSSPGLDACAKAQRSALNDGEQVQLLAQHRRAW